MTVAANSTEVGAHGRALLGSNVSGVGGIDKGFDQADAWRCGSIQIYSTPSRRWDVPALNAAVRDAFLQRLESSQVQAVIAHVPFLVNLATADPLALERSIARLVTEIRRADELRVAAVVLHPGAGGSLHRRDALTQVGRALREVVEKTEDCDVDVLLENMAGQGTALCDTFEELAELLDLADAGPRLGVCLDTAHAFIAGYPLTGYQGYDDVIGDLDAWVGLDRVRAVHLNDALTPQGSGHDRHAGPGEGCMGAAVFHAFMRDERFANRPAVLEVPDRDGGTLRALELLRMLGRREDPISAGEGLRPDAEAQLGLLLSA